MRDKLAKYNPYLLAIIILIPIIVHLRHVRPPQDLSIFPDYRDEFDLFTFCKSRVLIYLALFSCLFLEPRKISPVLFWSAVLFFINLAVSTFTSDYPYISMYGTPNYNEGALCWISYLAVLFAATQSTKQIVQSACAISAMLVAFFAVAQLVTGNFLMLSWIHPLVASVEINAAARPIYGTLGNPNHLGLYCALLFPYFLARKNTLAYVIPLIWMGVASASRAALVSFGVTSLWLLGKTRHFWLTLAVIAILVAAVQWVSPAYHSEVSNRLFIYKKSLPLLLDTIVAGKGMATFLLYFPQGDPAGFAKNFIVDRPHNFYIQLWHGAGFLGLASMLLLIGFSFQRGALRERAAIMGYLIGGLFTDSMVGVTPIFFAILGSCWIREEA